MHVVRVGATSMHECPSCASNWMESEAFTALCSSREERGAVVNLIGGANTQQPPAPSTVRYVACPVCKKLMNRSNFAHRSGVVIDSCKGHGVWLEAGELGRALAFIDSGGLEKLRDEQAHEMAEAAARLEKLTKGVASVRISIGGPGLKPADDTLIRRALEHLLF